MSHLQTDVSVVIVTYNSARYLSACLAALRTQGIGWRLIVVDNASRPAERPVQGDDGTTEVIHNTVNRGFSPAVNQALTRVRTPYVLLLNPDVSLMSDALARLHAFLEATPEAAAVSPRFWWDSDRTALLPLSTVPTLTRLMARAAAGHSRAFRHVLDCWHLRRAQRWWFAQQTVEVEGISAACVLISTRVLEQVGSLSPRFPLYYEETEWSLRARRHGYRLFTLPTAEAVHAFSHSYRQGSRRVQRWAAISRGRYWQGQYGRLGARVAIALESWPTKVERAATHDLGTISDPPHLVWSAATHQQVLEVALDPLFESAAALFPHSAELRWPASLWREMPVGTYYARLLCGVPLRPVTYWQWCRAAEPQDFYSLGTGEGVHERC